MTLKGALDQLATWSPAGITNLGLNELVVPVPGYMLPCLFPRLGGTGGEALRSLNVTLTSGRAVVHVEHVLLMHGLGEGYVETMQYAAVSHVDNYLSEAVDDLKLNNTLLEPLTISDIWTGTEEFGGVLYYAVVFRHRWVLKVD